MTTLPHEGLSYETALRVIGRHLDSSPSYHSSIVEGPNGFIVRSHNARHRIGEHIDQFPWDKLRSLSVLHTAARSVPRRRARHEGLWKHFPTGHEDFLRALGHDMDEVGARALTVDELDEGISISYLRPSSGSAYEPCHCVYSCLEVETLLTAAIGRRGHQVDAAS